jgi:hypothetical protein
MSTTKFFPPITSILPVDALPNELGFVKTGLTNILSHVYFRDLQCSHNDRGDSAFYSLSIVSLKRLDIEIPGTGIFLILNPAHNPLVSDISEFPIILSYRWPILGYLRQFNLDTFSFQPGDIFDLALRVVGVTQRQLVERALNLFVPSASPIDTFVDDMNALFGTNIAHPPSTSTDPLGDVLEEIDNTAGINGAGGAVFALYLLDALSEETTRDRISTFFEKFFDGDRIDDYIKHLLTPKIDATLKVGLALEFPRNVLEPLDAIGGEPLADQTIKTWLTFDAGSFFYNTDRGIGFDQALVVALNHPSRIAGTSFGISLHMAKLDISRTTNIPEATADGRPADFVGVYIDDATISFPAIWNHDGPNSTGLIKGKNLIIGTGGFSGTLSLEAVAASHPSPVVKVKFGDDFSISLDKFSIKLKQNAIIDSTIEGTLMIPGFKDANNNPAQIRIKVAIRQNGDFDVTAHEDDGFKEIVFPNIFKIKMKSVFFGKKDDDFYLGVSGTIIFTTPLLSSIAPIEVEKLLIWSDGRFEIEGGTIPLPKNVRFPIGPVELSISAIHLGSHQQEKSGVLRNYRYFGFDGGVDINPGGLDVRGKGIKFYYTIDDAPNKPPDRYLEIKSLAIDLVIPGNASKETATLLVSGFLSVGGTATDPAYEGGVSFSLPKAKIAGGASMKYQPKKPAFLVDAFVDLSTPIPLGSTSLGIYGFRGLFGQRYVPDKKDTETWFDYYKDPPSEGVSVSKFKLPDETKDYDNPFAIGAGVSLATMQGSGQPFSLKLFLLLSLPDVIYLEGKANILGPRVGLTGDDPPFSAVLAISSQSVELAAGVNYKLPREDPQKGWILDLHAEMRAAFFFHNSSAWYINVGTIQNPTTARILSLFDASSYLMISAAGIAAGAGVTYGFEKSYAGGLVHASVGVYIKVGGFISFERPQIGGFAMLGGHVDVRLMRFSFYIVIDTSLSVEVARPFFVQGKVHLCVGIKILKKKLEKCFDVEFKWEKNPNGDPRPVLPFADPAIPGAQFPLKATNMLSGESFNIASLGTSLPSVPPSFDDAVLPLDSWIDIEFLKGLVPGSDVDERIGRLSGQAPANTIDEIPPAQVPHKVTHAYSIKAVEISAWNGNAWVEYRPYQAMSPPQALAALNANPTAYKDGFWQNSGSGFNKIRLLAETSLSYMQQGQPGWYVPEQFGITSATLFCSTKLRDKHCIRWADVASGTEYPDGAWRQNDTVLWCILGGPGTVIDWNSHFGIPRSIAFANEATAQIVFNQPCVEVGLKLTTFSTGAVIRFYKRETVGAGFVFTLVETRTLTQLQLLAEVRYNNSTVPVTKVEIDPITADPVAVYALRVQIDVLYRQLYEVNPAARPSTDVLATIHQLEQQLAQLTGQGCTPNGIDKATLVKALHAVQQQVDECVKELEALQAAQQQACKKAADFKALFKRCFPKAPPAISYDIIERSNLAGRAEFVFRVYDDQSDAILFDGVLPYADAVTAERATFDTLELALWPGDYALMAPMNGQYFFQLVDTLGRFAAVSPATFTTWDKLVASWDETQVKFRTAHTGGTFTFGRRVAGKPPCKELFECCAPKPQSGLSYDILERSNLAGRAEFLFRVYDNQSDAILFDGSLPYADASTAERATFDALELALWPGDYALMAPTSGHFFLQLVDTLGRFAAVSPATFTTWDKLITFWEETQAKVRAAHAGGKFALARRVAGKLPCEGCADPLDCWNELLAFGVVGGFNCRTIVADILSARDVYCSQYHKLYRALYDCNKQLLDAAIRNCDELTSQVNLQHEACQALSDQLAAIQQLISFIDHNGVFLPPEGFPCSTLLHEACSLSLEDYEFNVSVPSLPAIQKDYANAVEAIEKMLTPMWRPATKYSIHLQVTDTVNGGSPQDSHFYFGFRTAGPLGYFDTDPKANYVVAPKTRDQYMLTGLKGYIDYRRSYPNADGQLTGAKPLFYEDARILLFFTKRYVYHFFGDWPAYNGLPPLTGNAMQIIIKDPAENISFPNPPPPLTTTTVIPQAVTSWPADDEPWPTDDDPRIPEDIRTLLNLRNPELLNPQFVGGQCWESGGDMITPARVYTMVTPQYLKPLKLYTIVVNNVYQGQIQEVHSFVCQTSRYPDFAAQVNSYHLDDGKGNHRDAIFRIDVPLSVADVTLMHDVVSGNMSGPNAALAGTLADPFDRLVEGVMKLTPLNAAVSTEFNIVRNSTTNAVVAVWIRNPEPFNDPKLPDDVLPRSLRVMNGPNPDLNYEVLFSKDRSQAFVMHPSKVIPVTQMKFRFAYIEWDGTKYVDHTVVNSGLVHMNI